MIEPNTAELPLEQSIESLTGYEIFAAQKHYGELMENWGGMRTLYATVWALENRKEKTSWQAVESASLKDLNAYFPQTDPDPESHQGKGLSSYEPRLNDSDDS